LNISEKC